MTSSRPRVRIGARPSPLSVAQVDLVTAMFAAHGVACEFVPITTAGDTDRRHLTEIGGTGIFAQAVRAALAAGEVDVAVHSAKDLPTAPAPGLVVAAHPVREATADVLVGHTLADLARPTGPAGPAGQGGRGPVRVGTGSPRREVQLLAWAQDAGVPIEVVPIRGNVGRRLDLVESGEVDAVVLAAAGVRRLGLFTDNSSGFAVRGIVADVLGDDVMLPAPAQGALALEVAGSRDEVLNLVKDLDDPTTSACVAAERALLARLEAGCLAPVGAVARPVDPCGTSPDLTLSAFVGRTIGCPSDRGRSAATPDRVELIRLEGRTDAAGATALGTRLAEDLLARLGVTTLRSDS